MIKTPSGYYTAAEVALLIGRSKDTIERWRKEGRYVPSKTMKAGKLVVYLYGEDDVAALHRLASVTHPGRKPGVGSKG